MGEIKKAAAHGHALLPEPKSEPVSLVSLTLLETTLISLAQDAKCGNLPAIDLNYSSGGSPNVIQFYLDTKFYDSIVEHKLRSAMNKIEQQSCVRFESVPVESSRSLSKPLIRFTNPNLRRECSHEPVFNKKNYTVTMVLGIDCLRNHDILHSLLHAIGFNDEVTRPDRDYHVRIQWDNIHPKYLKLFRIRPNQHFMAHHISYDFLSVMQFQDRAFSSNGRPTIIRVGEPGETGYGTVPQAGMWFPSSELSALDKLKLRILFGSSCLHKKQTKFVDSCKIIMKSDKEKLDNEINNDSDKNIDGGSDNNTEKESGKKFTGAPEEFSEFEDPKTKNDENVSGPQIVEADRK